MIVQSTERQTWSQAVYHKALRERKQPMSTTGFIVWEGPSRIDSYSLGTPEEIDAIRGKIIAVCELADIREYVECRNVPWASGPFCWLLDNVRLLDYPISAKGRLCLWDADIEI